MPLLRKSDLKPNPSWDRPRMWHQNKAGEFTVWILCSVYIKSKSSVLIKNEALFPFGIKYSLSNSLLRIIGNMEDSQPICFLQCLWVHVLKKQICYHHIVVKNGWWRILKNHFSLKISIYPCILDPWYRTLSALWQFDGGYSELYEVRFKT